MSLRARRFSALSRRFRPGDSTEHDVTTLGRGGSDTTAVAIAASLGAACEIYADVDGVLTADPQIVPDGRKLDTVSYAARSSSPRRAPLSCSYAL